MNYSRFLAVSALSVAVIASAPRAHAQTLSVTGPIDVSTLMTGGAPLANTVGDLDPTVIPESSGTAALGFLRIDSPTHSSGVHHIFIEHISAAGSIAAGPASVDSDAPLPTALGVTSDGVNEIVVFAGPPTSGQAPTLWARFFTGSTPTTVQLLPNDGAQLADGQFVARISMPQRVNRDSGGWILPVGITTRSTSGSQGQLMSVAFHVDSGMSNVSVLGHVERTTSSPIATVRAAGLGTGSAARFLDFDPPTMMRIHDFNDANLLPVSAASLAVPGFTVEPSGSFLLALGPGVASTPPLQLQCLESNGTAVTNSAMPCPRVPGAGEISAGTDPSTSSGAWIAGTTGDGNNLFLGAHGSTDAPLALSAPAFTNCTRPSVAAIDAFHAVVAAECHNPSVGTTPTPGHVLIWIAERAMPDAGPDAATDASADATAENDAANDASAMPDVVANQDASNSMDANVTADAAGQSFRGSGCACRTYPARSGHLGALIGALAIVAARRRRRTHV